MSKTISKPSFVRETPAAYTANAVVPYQVNRSVATKRARNAFETNGLGKNSTCAFFAHVVVGRIFQTDYCVKQRTLPGHSVCAFFAHASQQSDFVRFSQRIGQRSMRTNFTELKTPKGFHLTARGCVYPRYPGNVMNENHNPKGVASHHATPEATPLGLLKFRPPAADDLSTPLKYYFENHVLSKL